MARRKQGFRVVVVLLLGGGLLCAALVDGAAFGVPKLHLLEAAVVFIAGLGWIAHVLLRSEALHRSSVELGGALISARSALETARSEMSSLSRGLSERVDEQLVDWELTRSEREVAMLLLKGLQLRQIGELRKTSERTARQQAVSIYQKAGLSGRAELSAYFFEDLLVLPSNFVRSHASASNVEVEVLTS